MAEAYAARSVPPRGPCLVSGRSAAETDPRLTGHGHWRSMMAEMVRAMIECPARCWRRRVSWWITVSDFLGGPAGWPSRGASHAASQKGWRALRVHRHSAARVSPTRPSAHDLQTAAEQEGAPLDGVDGGRDSALTGQTWRLGVQGPDGQRRMTSATSAAPPASGAIQGRCRIDPPEAPGGTRRECRHRCGSKNSVIRRPGTASPATARLTTTSARHQVLPWDQAEPRPQSQRRGDPVDVPGPKALASGRCRRSPARWILSRRARRHACRCCPDVARSTILRPALAARSWPGSPPRSIP